VYFNRDVDGVKRSADQKVANDQRVAAFISLRDEVRRKSEDPEFKEEFAKANRSSSTSIDRYQRAFHQKIRDQLQSC
jgi:hypothetical protein